MFAERAEGGTEGSTVRGPGTRPSSRESAETGMSSIFSRPWSNTSGQTLFSAISEGLPPVVQEFRRQWQKLKRTGGRMTP